MKKIFIILVLLVIMSGFIFSDPIKLSSALELGYAPTYKSLNITPVTADIDVANNIGYVLFEAEVLILNTLFIGGVTKTYIQTTNTFTKYHPFENDYLFNAGLKLWNLEIGYRHLCLHPSRPYEIVYQYNQSTDGWYDEFYIRIEVSLD